MGSSHSAPTKNLVNTDPVTKPSPPVSPSNPAPAHSTTQDNKPSLVLSWATVVTPTQPSSDPVVCIDVIETQP